jgi:hypothetical protein
VNHEEKIERIARAAHNVMVTYCKMHGDYSFKEWEDAEQWQRTDTIAMVNSVLAGNYSPKAEHDRWLQTKVKKGYVYGAVKNDDKEKGPLTNPNIMVYEQLPLIQRMKDHLLIVTTVGMASHYGLKVEKIPDLVLA